MVLNLKKIIFDHGDNHLTKANFITDGQYTCDYKTIYKTICELTDLYKNDQQFQSVNTFYFNNTVPDVILLLWLIIEKKSFILISSESKVSFRQKKIRFYGNEISISYDNINDNLSFRKKFIHVKRNENYKANEIKDYKSKLFLQTSGSTDESKIVQHSTENLLFNSENCKNHLKLSPSDRILIPVPVYHMYGLGAALLPSILTGCSICLINKTNIIKYLSAESSFKPSVSFLTPSLSKMLVRIKKNKKGYRLVISAGDKMEESLYIKLENQLGRVVNLYGSTELGVIATSIISSSLSDRKAGKVAPLHNVQLKFIDVNNDFEGKLPVKEVVCNHSYGFEKYIDSNGDNVNSPNFSNNWFKTSDLCHINEQKSLTLIGRKNHSINRNGILVTFSEVEDLISKINNKIDHIAVLALDKETKRGKMLIACCNGKNLTQNDANEIRFNCISKLSRHLVPDEIKVIDTIPLLQNGKIDRIALQKLIK